MKQRIGTLTSWGFTRKVRIGEETRNSTKYIQAYSKDEDGYESPDSTLSRTIFKTTEDYTMFAVRMSVENIGIFDQLVDQGILTIAGDIATIYWQELSWEEIEKAMAE